MNKNQLFIMFVLVVSVALSVGLLLSFEEPELREENLKMHRYSKNKDAWSIARSPQTGKCYEVFEVGGGPSRMMAMEEIGCDWLSDMPKDRKTN